MGKSYQGVHGNYFGKVGNVVARAFKGRTLLSIYQPNVSNPKTTKQTNQRLKFALAVDFAARCSGWAGIMMKNDTTYGSGYTALVKSIFDSQAIIGTSPNYELQFGLIEVSKGSVPLPTSPSAVVDSQTLNVVWTSNVDGVKALETDKSCVLVYNASKKACLYQVNIAARSAGLATLTLPSAWSGDSVEVWLAMRRDDGSAESNSAYLGNIPI